MKKWEIIMKVLDGPDRLNRAISLFELLELQRKQSVEEFKKSGMSAAISAEIKRRSEKK